MKSHTDIEQSKKLAEILPLKSADMHYCFNFNLAMDNWWRTIPNVTKKDNHFELYPNDIPCWSLAALLDVYPVAVGKDLDMYCCWQNSKNLCSKHYNNPVDACVEMILRLHEQKLI